MSSSNQSSSNVQASPGSASKTATSPLWFTEEIQKMMHGFGDCRRPLHESAALIDDIVHQQMASLLYQLSDIATIRNARFIGIEDILFLLRKDKEKLQRILKYMDIRDVKTATLHAAGLEDSEAAIASEKVLVPAKKRKKLCYDFIASIDQTGELLSLFDDDIVDVVKKERLLRSELQTQGMDAQQYEEYTKSRQYFFLRKNKLQRFKDWLMTGVNIEIKPNILAMETICHLTYETIAQVVDLALIVRQDMKSSVDDPMSVYYPNVCQTYSKVDQTQDAAPGMTSPLQSPPSTPTNSGSLNSSSGSGMLSLSSSQGSTGLSSAKPKAKKRKRSGHSSSNEMLTSGLALKPLHIKEAMRRYNQYIGPFANQMKVNSVYSPRMRLLCS